MSITLEEIYYYDRKYKMWVDVGHRPGDSSFGEYPPEECQLDPSILEDLNSRNRYRKFIIMKNTIYAGIRSKLIYVKLDSSIKFVCKDMIYRYYTAPGITSNQCLPLSSVMNKSILKKIKTDYPSVVHFIDKMQRDEHPRNKEDEEGNFKRAAHCFDILTDDQKMYYMIEGDQKYLI